MANPTLATSTTSLVTGTGTVTFVTQPSVAFKGRVNAKSASTSDWMEGAVSSYINEDLILAIDKSQGTGTHADWNLSLAVAPTPDTGPITFVTPDETLVGIEPTSSAMQIPRRGAVTVAVITTTATPKGTNNAVTLPKDAQINDVVEVHMDPASTGPGVLVFPNQDEAIGKSDKSTGKNSASVATGVGDRGVVFRKVSKSLWLIV